VFYNGKFYALDLVLGPINLAQLKPTVLETYQERRQCFIASSLAELKQRITQAGPASPELVEVGYKGFNLVAYRGRVYGLALTLGSVDLRRLETGTLEGYHQSGQCFIGASLEDVKQHIAQANKLGVPDRIASG
jgi:hypothetical protein